jgi:hypothetical protein
MSGRARGRVRGLEPGCLRVNVDMTGATRRVDEVLRLCAALGRPAVLAPDDARAVAALIALIDGLVIRFEELRRAPAVARIEAGLRRTARVRLARYWCDVALVVAAVHAVRGVVAWI